MNSMTQSNAWAAMLAALGTKTTGNHCFPLINASGVPQGIMSAECVALLMNDNVKIAVTRLSDNYPLYVDAASWPSSYNNSSYITDGVVVCDGNSTFVIGKDEQAFGWAPQDGYGFSTGNEYISGSTNTYKALADFNGTNEMANIYNTAGYMQAGYAGKYLQAYTTVSGYSSGWSYDKRKAGMWRLPSLGELGLIYANKKAINAALSLIGGTRLTESWYWSCTEYASNYAWGLGLSDGGVLNRYKSLQRSVRPVCAF